jgi:hypothetical protein
MNSLQEHNQIEKIRAIAFREYYDLKAKCEGLQEIEIPVDGLRVIILFLLRRGFIDETGRRLRCNCQGEAELKSIFEGCE